MESDLQQHHHLQQFHHDHNHQNQQSQKQTNSGLTRYQSAPSSYFSSFMDRDFGDDFLNRPPSPETERIFARFLESYGGENTESNLSNNNNSNNNNNNIGMMNQSSSGLEGAMEVETKPQLQLPPPQINLPPLNNTKPGVLQRQQRNYSSASQDFYQQNLQNQNKSSELDYRMMGSAGFPQTRTSATGGGGNNSNLIRHSSSPAGLFSDIKIENGYVVMKGTGDYEGGGHGIRGRDQPTFSSSGTQMSPIAELGSNNNNNEGFNEVPANTFSTGFPIDPWDESSVLSENMGGIKRFRDDDRTLSGPIPSETQNVGPGIRPPPLAHHLSLPSDIATMEKLLQLHDSVPCKIRAKRGCATHPRSIAERVRRTKISERMRKLQELVPNMDKQTNTADMLDLAVDYVKELQQQVKALSDNRAKCTCSNKQPV